MDRKPRTHSFVGAVFIAGLLVVFLANPSFAADTTLAWDPNSEADLAGYGAYYFRLDDPAAVYNLFGYAALGELNDPSNPTITVTGLDSGVQYQFAVTAYDASGNESSFSIPVCAEVGTVNVAIACPSSVDGGGSGGGSGGGGGGGGGGCFIRSISADQDTNVLSLIGLSIIWLIAVLIETRNKAA
jgi:hypothetical protein